MEKDYSKNVGKVLVIIIATTFLSVGLASGIQTYDEPSLEINEKMDKNLIDAAGTIDVRINIVSGADMGVVSTQLEDIGATIHRTNTASVNYFECTIDAQLIDLITGIDEVVWIQQIYEPQTLMDLIQSNTFMGMDTPQANVFRGAGILAEVVDDGVDLSHPDLGQVLYTDFAVSANSHGTCTTGIMFGDGTGDAQAQGVIYEATGVFADWGNGNALGIQNLWNGLFSSGDAGQNGVLQTNSWWNGATMDGEYDAMSNELDQAIIDYPKVLTHWAIGNSNSGTAEGLMSAESISKNNIAVGAIYHKDTADTSDDDWSSNGNGATPSRGPAADGRVKPDMLGTFDWIYTTDQVGGAGYTSTDYYDNFGGTSGATPTVAGASGQAYDMYQANYFDNNPTGEWPYSSTIKALMIADAFQYPMTGGNLITRNVQGWGSPDMENMYNLADQYHVIEEYPQALNGGESWSRGVFSDGLNPLKITLAWIDPAAPSSTVAGRALINNLDLHVTSPSGTEYWGNNGLGTALYSSSGTGAQRWSSTSSYRDDLNNVENVFILTPEVGVWTVEVQGRSGDLPGPQDFSMVASGATGISSAGTLDLDRSVYMLEDSATITVSDLDLDTDSGTTQTVNVNIDSTTEPAGETVTLTETAVDSATFEGTVTLSATNGAGILQVSHADTVTATYDDADDGTGTPQTVIDTAVVDGQVQSATGLTVVWFGVLSQTLINEGFDSGVPPTGWSEEDPTGDWSSSNTNQAGGTAPEARFTWFDAIDDWRLYSGPLDTSGMPSVDFQFRQFFDDFGAGVTVKIQTSSDGTNWNDAGWSIASGGGNVGPSLESIVISTADVGSSTFRVSFTVSGNGYQLDSWYVDDALLTYTGGGLTDDNKLDWTLSGDDGAGANDVDHYNVYRADNSGGPWTTVFDTVPAGTATYIDYGAGEFDGTVWWYVVRAVDTTGNIDTNTNAIPEPSAGNGPPNAPFNPVPADGATGVAINPTLSVDVTDSDGDTMTVSFYDASGPTLLGTDNNVASGGTASVSWNGLSESTTYSWYAVANDGEFDTTSATWSFTTLDTTPPAAPTGLTVEHYGITTVTTTDRASTDYQDPNVAEGEIVAGSLANVNDGDNNAYYQLRETQSGDVVPANRYSLMAWIFEATITGGDDVIFNVQAYHDADADGDDFKFQYSSAQAGPWTDMVTVTDTSDTGTYLAYSDATLDAYSGLLYIRVVDTDRTTGADAYYGSIFIDDMYVNSTTVGGSGTDDNVINWTASADDGAGANDVDYYQIYRSDVDTGPWDATTEYAIVTATGAATYSYTDTGAGTADATLWWYVVRAVDLSSNMDANTVAVQEPGIVAFPYDIPIPGAVGPRTDWVFVSFPYPMSGPIGTVLDDSVYGGGGTTWDVAKWFNIQDTADPWKTYRNAATDDLATISNLMGVWIHLTASDGTLTTATTGDYSSSDVSINLYTGWNLVSYPSATPRLASDTLPGSVTMVAYYDSGSPYLITEAAPGAVTLTEGNAYWVLSTSLATWNVAP